MNERCYWCGRPLSPKGICPGCRQRGRKYEAGEIADSVCGCDKLPLMVAADALRAAADALEVAADDAYRLSGDVVRTKL